MNIKRKNKFVEFFKRFGVYIGVGAIVLAVTLTFAITAAVNSNKDVVDVGGNSLKVSLPMEAPTIVKDFSSTALQENTTLNQWEAHLAIDMTSENNKVYSIMDGTVTKVDYDYLIGNTIEVTHKDGLVSYYCSLDKDALVKVGDSVKSGDQLGTTGLTASAEKDLNAHLHFYMTLNGEEVDPNNYLDLQNK